MSDLYGIPPLPPAGRSTFPDGERHSSASCPPRPPNAPTVLLLHGWTATADLNWFGVYETLGRHFRVVAMDHRGHGLGIRTRKPFRLADCATMRLPRRRTRARIGDPVATRWVAQSHAAVATASPDRRRTGAVRNCWQFFAQSRRTYELPRPHRTRGLGSDSRPESTKEWLTERVFLRRKAEKWDRGP